MGHRRRPRSRHETTRIVESRSEHDGFAVDIILPSNQLDMASKMAKSVAEILYREWLLAMCDEDLDGDLDCPEFLVESILSDLIKTLMNAATQKKVTRILLFCHSATVSRHPLSTI
ncbi:hypothetical protein ACFL2Q_17910 [Thermodesulfobacteriota bacterium]